VVIIDCGLAVYPLPLQVEAAARAGAGVEAVGNPDSTLGLSSEHVIFRTEVSSLAEKVLKPAKDKLSPDEYIPGLLTSLADSGLLGLVIDELWSGSGGDALCLALAMEELGAVDAGLAGALSLHYLCSRALNYNPGIPFFQESLQTMARGDALGALALTEPGAGSNPEEVACYAAENSGRWRLNGNKCFVCNVDTAPRTFILTLAREAESCEITCFLIPFPSPGITPIHRYVYLGWDTIYSWAMVLADCMVPDKQVIGARGKGLSVIAEPMSWGRAALAAGALGLARSCCQLSIDYAQERRQFSLPIIHQQAVLFRIADMALHLEVGRTSLWKTASSGGFPDDKADMLYIFCGECAEFCSSTSLEIHGGLGYTVEGPMAELYRDAKGFKLALGTADLARMRISQIL
jgi:alkylation response protein AidB-like acyl-CoA dehydrogenase